MTSNLKKLLDPIHRTEKRGLSWLHQQTGITYWLLKGYYARKFQPNISDALKIAESMGLRVEEIWHL